MRPGFNSTCGRAARVVPPVISSLFHLELKDAGRSYTSPKLIVYLLSRPAASQLAGSVGCDPALQGLEHLADLLEQYYHPSNTGSCAPNYRIVSTPAVDALLSVNYNVRQQ